MLLALLPLLALHVQTPPVIPAPRVIVTETPPRIVLQQQLRGACGNGHFDACTKFVGYYLRVSCSTNGEGWSMNGFAEFTPLIMLQNAGRLRHERRHIEDIKQSTENYVSELQSQTYRSHAECEEVAVSERLLFGKRLNDFAQESLKLRE